MVPPRKTAYSALFNRRSALWLGVALFLALVFIPHVLSDGFLVDDWGIVKIADQYPTFWANYASWFPLFSNRPAAPLLISAVSLVAGSQPWIYILVNLALWLGGLGLIAYVIGQHFSVRFVVAFLLLGALPAMASTVIFSIGMQAVGGASILLWAISFYCLDRHLKSDRYLVWLIASYLVALVGLLVYELALPFFILSMLYPAVVAEDQPVQGRGPWRYPLLYVAPVFGLLGIIYLLQKVVIPRFMTVYSRLNVHSLPAVVHSSLTWLWSVSIELPLLWLNGARRLWLMGADGLRLAPLAIGLAGLALLLLWVASRAQPGNRFEAVSHGGRRLRLAIVIGLTLLAASGLYAFSGQDAQVYGYFNRGLTSTWILVALFLAVIYDLAKHTVWRLFLAGLIVLNLWTFLLQRDGYHRAWIMQQQVGAVLASQLAPQLTLPPKAGEHVSLLGYVPAWLPDNFNDEEVISDSWDFTAIIWSADRRLNIDAMPIKHDEITWPTIGADQVSFKYWASSYDNLWFFTYDAETAQTRLERVPDAATLTTLLGETAAADFNRVARAVPLRVRYAIDNSGVTQRTLWLILALPIVAWLGIGALVLAGSLSQRALRRSAEQLKRVALAPEAPALSPDNPSSQTVCRVCGGTAFDAIKPPDTRPGSLQMADFKVTDSRYGVTLAIARCRRCGFLQCPESEDVLHFYEEMQDPAYESGRPARKHQFRAILRQLRKFAPTGRLLDVGAGTGMLVEQALAAGYKAEGVEPSTWMVEQAATLGLPVFGGVLPNPLVNGPYQAVTLVDVIEHVPDPAGLLNESRALLSHGGVLLVVTPDVSSLAAQLLGGRWWHYRLAHINYFSPATLNHLLQRCGFEIATIQYSGWYFELAYLFERLGRYLPGRPKLKLPAFLGRLIVPLNLYDSLLLVCRQTP